MSDFWKGWMYAALFITATLFLGPVAVEALQWRPEDSAPAWYENLERGFLENAPFIVGLVGAVVVCNLGFMLYGWLRKVIAEGPEE